MVNEDILTALRNAVEHGESFQSAANILINSGYNPREVQEASNYLGSGITSQETRPHEELTMPAKKNIFGISSLMKSNSTSSKYSIPSTPSKPSIPSQSSKQFQAPGFNEKYKEQDIRMIKKEISSAASLPLPVSSPVSSQDNYSPPRVSYAKEIILLMILLILIAILIGTIFLRERIVNFFLQFAA